MLHRFKGDIGAIPGFTRAVNVSKECNNSMSRTRSNVPRSGKTMKGLLVRVGIDSTPEYGAWNAPVNTDNRFVFVPIKDHEYNVSGLYIEGGNRQYEEVIPELDKFARECGHVDKECFELPARLHKEPMHLDPDFLKLTYGDKNKRGKKLLKFGEDDFIAFYSSLRQVSGGTLTYALIGLFVLAASPRLACEVPASERRWNAHTRWNSVESDDIVVYGKPGQSGLFERCIPIGEFRDNAYRVTKKLLGDWGELSVENGWIQRSANPPKFEDPRKFRSWLDDQKMPIHAVQYQAPKKVELA